MDVGSHSVWSGGDSLGHGDLCGIAHVSATGSLPRQGNFLLCTALPALDAQILCTLMDTQTRAFQAHASLDRGFPVSVPGAGSTQFSLWPVGTTGSTDDHQSALLVARTGGTHVLRTHAETTSPTYLYWPKNIFLPTGCGTHLWHAHHRGGQFAGILPSSASRMVHGMLSAGRMFRPLCHLSSVCLTVSAGGEPQCEP